MPVPSQEHVGYYPFVWYVWAFDFAIWLGAFRFEFSSEFCIICYFSYIYTSYN